MSGIDDFTEETKPGHCATLAALVLALDESGVLPKSKYRQVLQRLWLEMDEAVAVGEAGAVIEQVLDLLETDDAVNDTGPAIERQPERHAYTGQPVNDGRAIDPLTIPLRAVLHTV